MQDIVFVSGLWRSGTSILALVLKELGVYMGDEFNHRPALKAVSPTGNWEEIRLKTLCHEMMRPPHLHERMPRAVFQRRLGEWMHDQYENAGVRLPGGKHPILTYFLPDLAAAAFERRFSLRVIDIERSSRATIDSMCARRFFGGNRKELHTLVTEGLDRKRHGLDQIEHIQISMRDLIEDTGRTINEIVSFLSINACSDTRLKAADIINHQHVHHGY